MEKEIRTNFHTHTFRCGHAVGDIEDYVKEAVLLGFKDLGISDHIFLPDIKHPQMRGDYSLLEEYIDTFLKVKRKYSSLINLYLGFESEYMSRFESYYQSLFNRYNFDYLILGQHFLYDEKGKVNRYFTDERINDIDGIRRYKDDLIAGMKKGYFLYVCHPDLFISYVDNIDDDIKELIMNGASSIEKIIDCSISLDIPLELNLGGLNFNSFYSVIRGTYSYPNHLFWKRVGEKKAKVVVGFDAHRPDELKVHPEWFLKRFISAHNLNIVDPKDVLFLKKNKKEV